MTSDEQLDIYAAEDRLSDAEDRMSDLEAEVSELRVMVERLLSATRKGKE